MASGNVAFLRSLHAGCERGDYSLRDWAHPEIEYAIADGPARGSWRGLDGMAASLREVLSVMEEVRVEVEEYCELDGERVLVLLRLLARARITGPEISHIRAVGASLVHLDGERVTRLVIYTDRERALVENGIAPNGGTPQS